MSLSSAPPSISSKILEMEKDIFDSSVEDFSSDDSIADPNFLPELNVQNDFIDSSADPNMRDLPSNSSCYDSSPQLTRKKQRKPHLWKRNVMKSLRQSGKQYTTSKNAAMPAKKLKPPCKSTCFFLCSKYFTEESRHKIFLDFWNLNDEEKLQFYFKFVKSKNIKRRRNTESTKKQQSYLYFFQLHDRVYRVCRLFFLNTLNIDKKRIYYAFQNLLDKTTGIPLPNKRGKHPKKCNPPEHLLQIRDHISSFKTVDSHYCRENSRKQYLELDLNLRKMYKLFVEKYNISVKESQYRKIFNYEFNYEFHKPRKDICNKCYQFTQNANALPEAERKIYEKHINEKRFCRAERELDSSNIDFGHGIICYDLQKVFGLPKGNASAFYYKSKLNLFNLTARLILPVKPDVTYCAIWTEAHSGRSGNDICSALIRILDQIVEDYPALNRLTLWSDSCVPQNRNKLNSTALMIFLQAHGNIKQIVQKFSEPGHSNIQSIDALHSLIENSLRNVEIYSPLHLVRLLSKISSNKTKLQIIQLKENDFKSYSKVSNKINFNVIPFMQLKAILYENNYSLTLKYKTSFSEAIYKFSDLSKPRKKKNGAVTATILKERLNILGSKMISKEKKDDIKSLLKYLPHEDKNYMKALLKI